MSEIVTEQTQRQKSLMRLAISTLALIGIYLLSLFVYYRFDLTTEKRFTLTPATREMLKNLDDVVYIRVYLEGELPAGIKRLRNATLDMLYEFRSYAKEGLEFEFIDPMEGTPEEQQAIAKQLAEEGLEPIRLIENSDGYSEKPLFPGAIINYKGRKMPVMLLQDQPNVGPQEDLNNSIALLEYNFMNALQKTLHNIRPHIGFVAGHGELPEPEIFDMMQYLKKYYPVDIINLPEQLYISPQKYASIIVAKPTKPFDDKDKFKIDQYVMNGGRVLWLVEQLSADLDSLNRKGGSFIAIDYNLNLDDLLFKYGARINSNLVEDLQCTKIPLTIGREGQLQNFSWVYSPVITEHNDLHPVSKNLDAVLLQFAGSIDTIKTVKDSIQKTILLRTSDYSRTVAAPVEVNVNSVRQPPNPEAFKGGNKPVAVALEGQFPSLFKNRLDPATLAMLDTLEGMTHLDQSKPTKMILISDGDIIRNDYDPVRGHTSPLGYYKYTGETFDNKNFLINCIEWLNDENGLIAARSKEVKLRLLDTTRIKAEKGFWQTLNMVLPLALVAIFGGIYTWWRRKKYA